MKTFHCDQCGQQVFYENVRCENCGGMLGFLPDQRAITTFEPDDEGFWRSLNPKNAGLHYKQCINYAQENACNWMLPADAEDDLCVSCQLTRTIPDLSNEKNLLYWKRLEAAKRRLLFSLWELNLQPTPKLVDDDTGMAFEFLEDTPDKKVMTGHDNGLIVINIAEADPSRREKARENMNEPYRTLLGHFRHESGHYYFDRLIIDTQWLAPFRELFGDEQQDYSESLERHYQNGPPADWEQHYVSSYASSHPWEDWAETWAHYLHMIDTLQTAYSCGMTLEPRKPREPTLAIERQPLKTGSFSELADNWFALTYVLNSLNRSIGMPDAYPFALSTDVMQKLQFIHEVALAQKTAPRT